MGQGLKLVLMRHAKSDWGHAGLSDKDRPLNQRGRDAVPKIARWLHEGNHIPAHALVSTAVRTRETWALLSECLQAATVEFQDELYLADASSMLALLRQQSAQSLILIGHNPGIAHLAAMLCSTTPSHPKFQQFPTSATLVLSFFAESWRDIQPGDGEALAFTVPRDLS